MITISATDGAGEVDSGNEAGVAGAESCDDTEFMAPSPAGSRFNGAMPCNAVPKEAAGNVFSAMLVCDILTFSYSAVFSISFSSEK